MLEHRPDDVAELRKFGSDAFNVDAILSTANNLKYSSAIKAELLKESVVSSPAAFEGR